jgi:hypothetical protein
MDTKEPRAKRRRQTCKATEVRLDQIDAPGEVQWAIFGKSATRIPGALAIKALRELPVRVTRCGGRYIASDSYLLQLARATLSPKQLIPVLIQKEAPSESATPLLAFAIFCIVYSLAAAERGILYHELLKLEQAVLLEFFGTWRKAELHKLVNVNARTARKVNPNDHKAQTA